MNAIQTDGLTKFYGRSRGIIDLDLEVHEGEFYGFIGPNGAGKSTTIRILMIYKGLDEPLTGIVEQQLPETAVRNGFTVVEWGGSEIMG